MRSFGSSASNFPANPKPRDRAKSSVSSRMLDRAAFRSAHNELSTMTLYSRDFTCIALTLWGMCDGFYSSLSRSRSRQPPDAFRTTRRVFSVELKANVMPMEIVDDKSLK
jgi:hypothetical protein